MFCCGFFKTKPVEETEVTHLNHDGTTDGNVMSRPSSSTLRFRPISPTTISPEITGSSQCGQGQKHPERWLNKRNESNVTMEDPKTIFKRPNKEQKITKIKERNKALEETNERHQRIVEEKDAELSKAIMKIQKLEEEKETLLTRLSAMASAKLTDGNANIADLSDENRPTKLAEKYSELYDNEWTDAYDLLTQHGETEENTCYILLKILCMAYNQCRDRAERDMKSMREAMNDFLGHQDPAPELIKPFKDQRKKKIKGRTKSIKKCLLSDFGHILPVKKTLTDSKMKIFLKKTIKLCWLMVIQDPPIFVDVNIDRSGEIYDGNSLKPYTRSGKYIDYIVWPPMYLEQGGNILSKGIAQGKPEEKDPSIETRQNNTSESTCTFKIDIHESTDVNRQTNQESVVLLTDEIAEHTAVQLQENANNQRNVSTFGATQKDATRMSEPSPKFVLENEAYKSAISAPEKSIEKLKDAETTFKNNTSRMEKLNQNTTADISSEYGEATKESLAKHTMSRSLTKKRKLESPSKKELSVVTAKSLTEASRTSKATVEKNEIFRRRPETVLDRITDYRTSFPNKDQTEQSNSADEHGTIKGADRTNTDAPKHTGYKQKTFHQEEHRKMEEPIASVTKL